MRAWIGQLRSRIHMLLREHLTPESIGLAVAVGIFLGGLPLYGLHIVLCVGAARVLKLNQALVYTAANISNPFFAPFLISGQILLGDWLRFGSATGRTLPEGSFWNLIKLAPDVFISCLLGSLVEGVVLGGALGLLALWTARRWRRAEAP